MFWSSKSSRHGGKNKLRMEMGITFGNMEYFSVASVEKKKKRDNLGGTSLVALL